MQSQEVTYHVQVLTTYTDTMGYTNIVFENLNCVDPDFQFIMAVLFPNWDQKPFSVGDIGFANIRYVREGIDKWFDGKDFNTYQFTNAILVKFIEERPKVDVENIQLD